MPTAFFLAVLAVFGLLFGSFGNVLIWRLPRGESVVSPPSHCPACDTEIAWYDNIPVFSWAVLLRGRCRHCGVRISPRYPLVELLSGLLWLFAGVLYGQTAQAAVAIFFFYLLLILAFIDIDTFRLPNPIVGTMFVVGLACAAASQFSGVALSPLLETFPGRLGEPLPAALVGAALSAGIAAVIAYAYYRVRAAQGFGMGDVKLLAAIGVFLGAWGVLAFFVGSVLGAIYGVSAARVKGVPAASLKFPLGPFLALGAVMVTAWGPVAWGWYLSLFA